MALSVLYWVNYVEGHTKLTRKSEAAVESGRVLRFVVDELRVITACVQASMRDTSYKVQIFLDNEDTGVVKDATCQCPMGQYKCHHIAAALLFGYKRASKTDVKCSWLKHPKSAPPKSTVTMSDLYPPKQQEYKYVFINKLPTAFINTNIYKTKCIVALHWILSEEPKSEESPVPLIEDLLMSEGYTNAEDSRTWLRKHLILSPEKIMEAAFASTGQRENSLWAAVRKLRFTASNFGQIIGAIRRKRLTESLKKRILSAYNLERRAPIQWGITHEKVGVEEYCKAGAVTVLQTGIWLHESGVLGASPDGFVQGDFRKTDIVHLQQNDQPATLPTIIEVKCPFTAKDKTIMEACSSVKDFFLVDNNGSLSLKTTHDYWHQIQGQLHLTGTECCDLVIWTTKDMQIVRIVKDKMWAPNISAMIDFYFMVFLESLK
ncbi:uncharacterized protein LOC128161649 [Crassostrea angulata]|uniref:uncharacterized protein LOC128161649 n=1 Tax=Magallana angulata TaxID=2784310 RepID=UPI0022B17393|nr:uncharacterized protein LOC128161649 [Crassostrea angulata]